MKISLSGKVSDSGADAAIKRLALCIGGVILILALTPAPYIVTCYW